ncbi:hypothetical protein F7R91_40105 [Streptomyces luteolifulvus]|uniref:Uncharacterized protein n=1 Tax=Streptomyces luteolifulvus TaxID=2615112 RepID=A0A6H9UND1_9ACTN|nr:hypothetical protein [Streptomyces luteolifulvus]KAB1139394.1 hypothetical protein F7R91_40105 [Streptomyces luteolifulvus]
MTSRWCRPAATARSPPACTSPPATGTVFVTGLRQDHPRVWTQQREADANPFTRGLVPAPALRPQTVA